MRLSFISGLVCGSIVTGGVLGAVIFANQSPETAIDLRQTNSAESMRQAQRYAVDTASFQRRQDDTSVNSGATLSDQSSISLTGQPVIAHNVRPAMSCDTECVNVIADKFATESELTSTDWDSIKDASQQIANRIADNPQALAALQETLAYTVNDGEIDSLISLISFLPDEKALAIIKDVSSYSSVHKASSLQALSTLSLYSENAAREVESLVIEAQNPDVIAAALDALESIDNYDFSPQTWQSLSTQFSFTEEPELKSAILLTLAKHGKGDPIALWSDIDKGLESSSGDLQRASVEAVGYLIDRSKDETGFYSTTRKDRLKAQLSAIANDPEAQIEARISALRLLDQAF